MAKLVNSPKDFNAAEQQILFACVAGDDELDNHPDLMDKVYEYFSNSGEMPYTIGKDDPYPWINDHLTLLTERF